MQITPIQSPHSQNSEKEHWNMNTDSPTVCEQWTKLPGWSYGENQSKADRRMKVGMITMQQKLL